MKRDGIIGLTTAFPDDDSLVNSLRQRGQSFGMKMLHVDEQTGKIGDVDNDDIHSSTAKLAQGSMLGPPGPLHG